MKISGKTAASSAVATLLLCACGAAGDMGETLGENGQPLSCLSTTPTTRMDVSSTGAQGGANSTSAAMSGDDRFVAFDSVDPLGVGGDPGTGFQILVHDRVSGQTTRESVSTSGATSNGTNIFPTVSGDGRYVAFFSSGTNLVAGDTNAASDIFRRDRSMSQTVRVSVANDGSQANGASTFSSISSDGRFVAFDSAATNLVTGDTNAAGDVFLRDVAAAQTTRMSVSTSGAQGNGASGTPAISPNALFVAFQSSATNLVTGDTNAVADIFVREVAARRTTRVSVSTSGAQGNDASSEPAVNSDGRFVVFSSLATNLVTGDTNLVADVFVRDRTNNQTTRVSVADSGAQANSAGSEPKISADGRFVLFLSAATNLVPGLQASGIGAFVRDRVANRTFAVSLAQDGTQAPVFATGRSTSLSADGKTSMFLSRSNNLVAGDTNTTTDVFVRETLPAATAWVTGHAYAVGDFVTFGGNTYQALQAHTSQAGWEPTNAPSLWVIPTPCGPSGWAINTVYVLGSVVTFNGTSFRAITAHTSRTGTEPPNNAALWQPIP